MKRQRQCNLKVLLRKFEYLRHDAAGGYGHISLTDVQTMLICQNADELQKVVVVVKGFSCSHDDHVGHPFFRDLLDLIDLSQHLGSR